MHLTFEKIRRLTVTALMMIAGAALLSPVSASELTRYGTPDKPPLNERYPSGSIDSVEHADEALVLVNQERALIDDQYIDQQRDCYTRFFVSHCLGVAKERNRVAVKQVREVEVEANAYKRKAKADDRDQSLAEQRVKDEQDAVRRAADQQERDAAAVRKIQESAVKGEQVRQREQETAGQADLRVNKHAAELRKAAAAEAAKAPQRAANEKAYKEKAQKAEAHRKEVEERKAQKARERAAKVQGAPVSDAPPPAPAK